LGRRGHSRRIFGPDPHKFFLFESNLVKSGEGAPSFSHRRDGALFFVTVLDHAHLALALEKSQQVGVDRGRSHGGHAVWEVLIPHSPDDALSFGTDGAIQI
jgi:hypothetical protein